MPAPPAPEPIAFSDVEYYRLMRQQIEHEANLLSQRLIWLIIAQSFLFSTLAVAANAPKDAKSALFVRANTIMFHAMPAIGLATGLMTLALIASSLYAMRRTRRHFLQLPKQHPLEQFPEVQSSSAEGFATALTILLPVVFVATWVWVGMAIW